jgi:hypothetical protein
MYKLQVNPKTVWGFYPGINLDKNLLAYITEHGWKNIPPVPVFEIPDFEGIERKHEYALLDGNARRAVAEFREEPLPIVVYQENESIDFRKDGLAESRNLIRPKRWNILMQIYVTERRGLKAEMDKKLLEGIAKV